jgi:hypothetical protein
MELNVLAALFPGKNPQYHLKGGRLDSQLWSRCYGEGKYFNHPFCIVATTLTAILATGEGVAYFKELFMHLPKVTGKSLLFQFGQQVFRPYQFMTTTIQSKSVNSYTAAVDV